MLFHTDAIQSFGKEPLDARDFDALSLAAHKFYGPKGAGLLCLRAGLSLERLQVGGSHEGERRAGTENVAAIAGMAAAAEYAFVDMEAEQPRAGGAARAALGTASARSSPTRSSTATPDAASRTR